MYDQCFQARLSQHHLQLNIIGQVISGMRLSLLYSAIARNSERSEENIPPYKLVKQEAIPQC